MKNFKFTHTVGVYFASGSPPKLHGRVSDKTPG